MEVVAGVDRLLPEHGPIFAVVGVFDGLHRGHAYLLEHLVREAEARSAYPAVITFDAHPDEVLTGSAPPLLVHPNERLERLAHAGVQVTVVQHFDEAVRRTPYDAFIATIQARTSLAGLLMTPDAAFGFERRGTPDALAALGRERGFDVVVVPPFTLDGQAVRSSDIRAAIAAGNLGAAVKLVQGILAVQSSQMNPFPDSCNLAEVIGPLLIDMEERDQRFGSFQCRLTNRRNKARVAGQGVSFQQT
jgi:riboflavin kinase/FMN adenylyltransferase